METEADAPAGSTDARPDAATGGGPHDAPAGVVAKLVLSEVAMSPAGHEFIEIANPGTLPVDLSTYYLSDNGNYFKLPIGVTIPSADFLVKFPAGATIPSHGVITVAIDTAATFTTAFGSAPTYAIGDGTVTTVGGSAPTLTDGGELVVLFKWDGLSSLVEDVDMLLAGVPTTANGLVSKSNLTQGTATYRADANTIPTQATTPGSGKSTKRLMLESGHQTQAALGNGVDGNDETSEVTTMTWDTTATYSTPTPGVVPTALVQ